MIEKQKFATAPQAQEALTLVQDLQNYFVEKLNTVSKLYGADKAYLAVSWLRDEGLHGGGTRYVAQDETLFNRASVNVSQVHYEEDESKKLDSATAISTIIHPLHPNVPSMHMHISWTQMKGGSGYWRIMADLNPSIEDTNATQEFSKSLEALAGEYYQEAKEQGDKYFFIPALKRHRGVSHFYLEQFSTGDAKADKQFAWDFGKGVIDSYITIISQALEQKLPLTEDSKAQQLDYHTLYLFQVLTLDRGTTSGLLIHDQNDVGIMGSIPKFINKELLLSWKDLVSKPQDSLVQSIVNCLPKTAPSLVDDEVKAKLAQVVRLHYQKH
ncbi:MAG: coproporphyrinogen III oxidase, partial [Thiovulaceae bacterium]|nr:coproporphyrinogen III oxidase [Sulfurimonadaceae bacterium]